jgi:hypothetical protein
VIKPPLEGDGWLATSGCCKPNVHRDLRVAIDGRRIETAETFAVDWARVKNDKIYDGDGSKNEQHYAFGADVLAVADGTVVSIQDGKPEATPNVPMIPETNSDFGGNHVILENRLECLRGLRAFAPGQPHGEGRRRSAGRGAPRQVREHRPLRRPSPAFRSPQQARLFRRTEPAFRLCSFTLVGAVDFKTSEADRLVILPDSRQVRSAYPLYGGIQNFP